MEKLQEILNKVLEIIKTWEIGDFIFVGIDILLLIIVICLFTRKARRNRKARKALKQQQKIEEKEEVVETVVEETVEEETIEEQVVEEVIEESKDEVVEETPEVLEVVEEVNEAPKKKQTTKKAPRPTPIKKEPVRPEKVKELQVNNEEEKEVYNSNVPFEKVTITLPNKVNYRLGKGWENTFKRARRNEEFKNTVWPFVYNSYLENKKVTPEKDNLFKPFEYCDPSHVKVVFINKQASLNLEDDGLAFSTNEIGQKTPMFNELYREAQRDRNIRAIRYDDGSLLRYAKQGVFLYNYILTNAVGESRKHETLGWEVFSNMVVKDLAKEPTPKVFVLFGSYVTNQVSEIITKNSNHKIIVVPSIQKIVGSNLFSEINEYLIENKISPINWSLGKIRK